jgi:hypothetical protein
MIILDTNVVSELMRAEPDRQVVRWVAAQPVRALFTTAITQAEILLGVALLPQGKRRRALESAVEEMFAEDFEGRVLAFDGSAAPSFASVVAKRRQGGRPISQADAQIAAIAACHGARIATRNVGDFEECGVGLVNPWEGQR